MSDTTADEEFLDRLLGRFLEDVAEGRAAALEEVLRQRPDLETEILEVHELARRSAVRRQERRPEVPGYEIVCELGRGGMGTVFLAQHLATQEFVALKRLTGRSLAGQRARERFERETRAVAQLDHPRIVRLREVGEADGEPYFAMDHVEGCSLAEVLSRLRHAGERAAQLAGADLARSVLGADATPPAVWCGGYVEACCQLALDIADALAHAHEHGVLHRDVKPSNVLLRLDGAALLVDFGLARARSDRTLTSSHDFIGTLAYAPPEQFLIESTGLSERSDVYSLGITLYEALTLRTPFAGRSSQEVLRAILSGETRPPSASNAAVGSPLDELCLRAIALDPAGRFEGAGALADALRAV